MKKYRPLKLKLFWLNYCRSKWKNSCNWLVYQSNVSKLFRIARGDIFSWLS